MQVYYQLDLHCSKLGWFVYLGAIVRQNNITQNNAFLLALKIKLISHLALN